MDHDFLKWYDENYPEDNFDINDYLPREEHKKICYSGWVAAKRILLLRSKIA